MLGVGLVAHVVSFQGIELSPVGLVSWCCRNMRPKMRPILKRGVARSSFDHLLVTAGGFVSAKRTLRTFVIVFEPPVREEDLGFVQ